MDGFLAALVLALPPAVGCLLGGVLAEMLDVSRRTLGLVLYAAAGIVFAVVSVELIPRAIEARSPWVVILAFAAGGGAYMLLDMLSDRIALRLTGEKGGASAMGIYAGVAVDLLTDGVTVGTGSTISFSLALLLALSQVPANIPTGFAAMAGLRKVVQSRQVRLLVTASFLVPAVLGATLGYWVVQGQPRLFQLALLGFTAGILATVVVEEMVPAAHERADVRLATALFIGGFVLFTAIAVYAE